uniref:hypothetical protein n=1 Tax=Aeromonas salmonicida TaxID=645 RepID=UPI00215B76AA
MLLELGNQLLGGFLLLGLAQAFSAQTNAPADRPLFAGPEPVNGGQGVEFAIVGR